MTQTCGGLRAELRQQQAPREAQQRVVAIVRRALALQLDDQRGIGSQSAYGARQ